MGRKLRLIATLCLPGCVTLALAVGALAQGEYNLHWGGFGEIPGRHNEDFCAKNRIEPGSSASAKILLTDAGRVLAAPGTAGSRTVNGVVICAPKLDLWGHTFGPWDPSAPGGPGWLTILCPSAHPKSLLGGAGFHTSPHEHVTWRDGRTHDLDGRQDRYSGYRFHNWSAVTVTIQFWGACV